MIVFAAVLSYLIGSLPSAFLLAKFTKQIDIQTVGSGNSGATNALRTLGVRIGVLTLVLDLLKGVVACLIGSLIAGRDGLLIAGLFAVLGHVFSLYLKFQGGKGVATSAGVLLVYDWRILVVLLIVFVAVVAISKYVSLGSVIAAVSAPIGAAFFHGNQPMTFCILGLAVLVIYKHSANIKRLLDGNERKLGRKS